jgi:nucleoside-diphosphate kinase
MIERTLVVLKPDAVQRTLVGEIIKRFENAGLKIAALKMLWVDKKFAEKHYPLDEDWAKGIYEKTKTAYEKSGKSFDYKDHFEIGKEIQSKNMNFLVEGPVVAMVLEGIHAIEIVRKMVGHTEPRQSLPGTIRGDFAHMSYLHADKKGSAVRNLIHASSDSKAAEYEIKLWFAPEEIHSYKNVHDTHIF